MPARVDSVFRKSVAELGDCVLIVTGNTELKEITLKKDGVTQTRFGALKHNDCIGSLYGSKVATSRGHVHILALDPVLWSVSLPHRTQIIYPPDASLIVGGLDLVPGCRVFEAGTGSGSLTHFLAQAVHPTGVIHTFEFHAGRVERAREEFKSHYLSELIHVVHRDVIADGFPNIGEEDNPFGVDAVTLDLPQPWLVVPHLPFVFSMEKGGRFCSFSPCIEQVQRTCAALDRIGFMGIQTVECLQRAYNVSRAFLNVPNMGQVGADRPLCGEDKNKWRTRGRVLLPPPAKSRLVHETETETKIPHDDATEGSEPATKKQKLDTSDGPSLDRRFIWEAIPQPTMSGHTGYLTFATWPPRRTLVGSFREPKKDEGSPDLPPQTTVDTTTC